MTLDFSARLRDEAARFFAVLRDADPAARVPSCPDWDADDLLWHLGEVFWFWGTVVRDRLPDPSSLVDPARPADRAGLLEFYADALRTLTTALDSTPDDLPLWSWAGAGSPHWTRRRMAHEALIHRLDAELTTGDVTGIDAGFAADGAYEALQYFHGGYPAWAQWTPTGPVGRLQTTDTGDAWLVRLGYFSGTSPDTGKVYDDERVLELTESAEPSFTVSATARDLDVWLWGRPPLAPPTVAGSAADYATFQAYVAKGID
jgi:uncharacterized protein (TIGR03083 family)